MAIDNVELIQRILSGDDAAFSVLVRKYQRRVHALIWRKVGDFHIAEEITQDAFLQVYKKLSTLKNPKLFDGWLYVIANRLCLNWIQRNKPAIRQQSIENTPLEEIEKSSYANYESEHREAEATEHHREIVKNLLETLPESERTVMTLHYLGEMTCQAIGEFLGVSPNTVKSRLQRARDRLKEQENMIRETLGSVQLPANFTESILRQVAEIKPVTPTISKPIVPWAVSAATALLIFLIMGINSQYLTRFQKPYNINAQSAITVEIIEAPIVLDTQAKPDLRNQAGRFDATGKNIGADTQVSEPVLFAAAEAETEKKTATKPQWRQATGPAGVTILGFFASSKGDVYATSPIGIYRLAPNAEAWTLVNATATNGQLYPMPMTEREDTLYTVSAEELLSSTDRGKTWNTLGSRPEGKAMGLIITDHAFYLAVKNGIYQSIDSGKQWTPLNDGFTFDKESTKEEIAAGTSIKNSVFVLTNRGLYRLNSGTWEKLPIKTRIAFEEFDSLVASGNNLYVAVSLDRLRMERENPKSTTRGKTNWRIFLSTDLGNSWIDITPINRPRFMELTTGIKLLNAGETLLALSAHNGIRSRDGGLTWRALGKIVYTATYMPAVGINENTFYIGKYRIHRTTDGGGSWHPFMKGTVGTGMRSLVAFKNRLYALNDRKIVKSTDGGELWTPVNFRSGRRPPREPYFPYQRLVVADGIPYGVFLEGKERTFSISRINNLHIFRLSADGDTLRSVRGLPALEFDGDHYSKDLLAGEVTLGELAVSHDTFYIEYRRELFKCKRGAQKWTSTGLIDRGKQPHNNLKGFQLAVSGETVYVGKRDGKLFQSFDGGDNWRDITPNLPLSFNLFREILFAGSTVYVATNTGVLTSQNGEHWHVLTDTEGERLIMTGLAVDGTTVYGVRNAGAYRLDKSGKWKKVSPAVPDGIRELVFANDRLYVITNQRGIFHVSLEKDS